MITRGGSRTAATSKIELFVIIVNGWQPLTIIAKCSILDVTTVLHLPLITDVANISITGTVYKPLLLIMLISTKILSTELFISIKLDGIYCLTYTRIPIMSVLVKLVRRCKSFNIELSLSKCFVNLVSEIINKNLFYPFGQEIILFSCGVDIQFFWNKSKETFSHKEFQ